MFPAGSRTCPHPHVQREGKAVSGRWQGLLGSGSCCVKRTKSMCSREMKGAGLDPASPGCPVQLLPANLPCLAVTLQQEGEKVNNT